MSKTTKKTTTIISLIALMAFVAFAALSAVSVKNFSDTVESSTIANQNGVPAAWSNVPISSLTKSETTVAASGNQVIYTTSLENLDQDKSYSVTHIASFLNGKDHGFVPLTGDSLEYSYSLDSNADWHKIGIEDPGEDLNSFKLSSKIYLGSANSQYHKVYFRYSVIPSANGTIDDKVAFITEAYITGDTALTISDSSIAFENTSSSVIAAQDNRSVDDDSGESAFAEPLGASTDSASQTDAVSLAGLGAISFSSDTVMISLIIVVACLGIFAISLIIYLIVGNRNRKKSKLY